MISKASNGCAVLIIHHWRNEKATAVLCYTIVSGIVTGDAPVSYRRIFFPVPAAVPEGLGNLIRIIFRQPLIMALDLSYTTNPLTWIKLLSPLKANSIKGPSMESFRSKRVFFLLPQQLSSLDIWRKKAIQTCSTNSHMYTKCRSQQTSR